MKILLIKLFKLFLNIVYFFMKLLPTNEKKVVFISRQSNKMTLDFELLKNKFEKEGYKVVVLTKRFDDMNKKFISLGLFILKQMYYLSTSKCCIVDSYCIPVSILKHKKSLYILQIWHSLAAIKEFGYQTLGKESGRNKDVSIAMNMHMQYENIISGSSEMTKYFAKAFNYPEDVFINCGLPRIDYLKKEKNRLRKEIYKKYPEFKNKKVILYAPTFRKDRSNGIDELLKNVDLKRDCFILKSHPNQKIKTNIKGIYKCPDFSSLDLLTVCDYLITDYSAISVEAAVLDVKTYYYVFDYDKYKKENGLNIDLYKEMPGCVFSDSKVLMKEIGKDNYNSKVLRNFKKKYLPKELGNSVDSIFNLVVEKCKER